MGMVEKQRVFLFWSFSSEGNDIMATPLIPVPSLSLSGWVNSGSAKADYLLSWFFATNYSQSNVFRGRLSSLQYLIFRYGQTPDALVTQIQSVLTTYLSRVYPEGVYVSVTHDANTPANPTDLYTVQLVMEVQEGGVTKSMGKLINYDGSKIVSIITTNNTGPTL
jgi:hypothetical protein